MKVLFPQAFNFWGNPICHLGYWHVTPKLLQKLQPSRLESNYSHTHTHTHLRSLRSKEKRQGTILGVLGIHTLLPQIQTYFIVYLYQPPNYILSSVSLSLLTFLLRSPQQGFSFQFCSIEKKNWQNFSPQKIVLLIQFTLETRNLQNFPKILNKKFRKK